MVWWWNAIISFLDFLGIPTGGARWSQSSWLCIPWANSTHLINYFNISCIRSSMHQGKQILYFLPTDFYFLNLLFSQSLWPEIYFAQKRIPMGGGWWVQQPWAWLMANPHLCFLSYSAACLPRGHTECSDKAWVLEADRARLNPPVLPWTWPLILSFLISSRAKQRSYWEMITKFCNNYENHLVQGYWIAASVLQKWSFS